MFGWSATREEEGGSGCEGEGVEKKRVEEERRRVKWDVAVSSREGGAREVKRDAVLGAEACRGGGGIEGTSG